VRAARICAIQVVAAALLILAATALPLASYKDLADGVTTTFRGGAGGAIVVVLGVVSIGMSFAALRQPSPVLYRIHLAVGCVALLGAVVLSLDKISAANHFEATGASQTSYAFGSAVAVLAAATIAFTALTQLRTSALQHA
jgi:hypothetical protein